MGRVRDRNEAAQVQPQARRAIQKDSISTMIVTIVVLGVIGPVVFGGIDFGGQANGLIRLLIILGLGWWVWRGR